MMRLLGRLWLASFVVAGAGTMLIYDSLPGLNWGIFTTLAALGLLFVMRASERPLGRSTRLLLLLAVVLGWSAPFTSAELFHVLLVVAIATLFALAAMVAAGLPLKAVGAARMLLAPPTVWFFAVIEVVQRKVEAIGLLRHGGSAQALRGALIAAPVVIVFTMLLAGADPFFNRAIGSVADLLERFAFMDQLVVFGVFGTMALGGYGMALRGGWSARGDVDPLARPIFGDLERVIVLGSVVTLFAIFSIVQLAYLFGDLGGLRGSGVTYAEYARRGFGELTVAATLGTGLLLALERWRAAGPRDRLARILGLTLILELHLLLESAMRRVNLYESAYGYTTDRLYGRVIMIGISAALLLLAWELWHGLDARRLARRCASVAAAFLLALTVWNHEAWIAERNIERSARTGQWDLAYLARGLSLDAAPAITANLHRLSIEQRGELLSLLHHRHYGPDAFASRHWWEWNARRTAGVRALRDAGIVLDARPEVAPMADGGAAAVP